MNKTLFDYITVKKQYTPQQIEGYKNLLRAILDPNYKFDDE